MKLNADLSKFAISNVDTLKWVPSPANGVYRKMLDRDGDEVARATTVVKYDNETSFPYHVHSAGEEFFVVQMDDEESYQKYNSSFNDELLEYKPGYYVRHPIDSGHQPFTSSLGCYLLVKLRQMTDKTESNLFVDTGIYDDEESFEKRIVPNGVQKGKWQKVSPGKWVMPLYTNENTGEIVTLEKYEQGYKQVQFTECIKGGEELYVLIGGFKQLRKNDDGKIEQTDLHRDTWMRIPSQDTLNIVERSNDSSVECIVYRKTGHLL